MKHWYRVLVLALLVFSIAGVASADFTGPFIDTYIITNTAGNNPSAPNLPVQDQTANCNDNYISYVQFDASTIKTVNSASLKFTQGGTPAGLNNGPTLSLYGVADFDPATLSGATGGFPVPGSGTLIQSIVVPSSVPAGYTVTWGDADPGLANYIQSQADGDNKVTLAMSFSANCFSQWSNIAFYSQEGGTAAQDPVLNIKGTSEPNAVSMSSASAERTSWPLYAGLAAVALVVVAGVMMSRRRTA